jgi:hypothetical protein
MIRRTCAAALLIFLSVGCTSQRANDSDPSVIDFGAVGDGKTDTTAAFQKALDAAAMQGGGIVSVPRGNFLFAGHLNIPSGVTLQGIWTSVPAHNGLRDKGLPKPTDDGTTFLVTADAGNENASPFITLNTNSTLRGVVIFYPNQTQTDVPTPYPYAVAMRGKNPAIFDCELLNPFNGIDAAGSERHLIRNIQGQPLRRGIYVDNITDIGRIENVHFNPWFSMSPKLFDWQMNNGEAFVFGRADWEYVLNTFCFGYHIGYRFIKTEHGNCNGNFLGIGADDCQTAVVVDDAAPYGLLITNGEFVSFHGPDPTMVRVSPSNGGVARFVNCAFWGPCNQIAVIDGRGVVGFSDCTFVQWDRNKKGRAAIQARGGSVIVRGCTFRENAPQVQLQPQVKRAVVTGNIVSGEVRIENHCANAVIADNVGDRK